MENLQDCRFLNTVEAAKLLGITRRSLENWRQTGEGPAFAKFGASVRYQVSVLMAWAAERSRQSTAETTQS